MTEQQDRNLEADWGPLARHSEYKRGDILRYRADGQVYTGTIIWIVAAGEESVRGRNSLPLPMHYICERIGWSEDSFPDVVYPADVLMDS